MLDRRDGRPYGAADLERAQLFADLTVEAVTAGGVRWERVARRVRRARCGSAYEAFDEGGVEAILDRVAPDFELRDRDSAPDRSTLVGGEGIRELVRLNMEVFDELELEPTEFIDRGEIVIVVLRMRVRGRSSGVAIDCETVHAWEFSEGRAADADLRGPAARARRARPRRLTT